MWIGNLDGTRQGLIIASSKKRAAEIANTSRIDFDNYWTLQPGVDQSLKSEVLYMRAYDGKTATWSQRRAVDTGR